MANILVNIVSEQTIPNYLFIKEFQDIADAFLFISTKEMEKKNKTKVLCDTARIETNKIHKIIIDENELFLIKKKLDGLGWKNINNRYYVNITGGTKLMSIAVKEYFQSFDNKFFYLPIGKNSYSEIFSSKASIEKPVGYELSVKEYLNLYGIEYEMNDFIFDKDKAINIFNKYKNTDFKDFPVDLFPDIKLHISQKIGLWFEYFIYYRIKELLNLDEKSIVTGIKLYKRQKENNYSDTLNDNEIDIVFIKNNRIYIIELKSFLGGMKINTAGLSNYLYKIAAVNKRFGLNAKSTLFTLSDFNSLHEKAKQNLIKRCNILNIYYPLCRNNIEDEYIFKKSLNQFIK